MKLRNVYILCRDNIDAICGLTATNIVVDGRSGIRVTGWETCRNSLDKLSNVPSLTEKCEKLISNVPTFFVNKDLFNITTEEWSKISSAKADLKRTIEDIMDLYEKMGMVTEEKIGIDIKLPPFNDFAEFVKCVSDIEFVFSKCPFLQNDVEKFEFENVDVGSTWLTFVVVGGAIMGGSILLNNIAAFIDKCIVIREHYLLTEKRKYDLEQEKKNEEQRKIIVEYIDELYKKEVDRAIKELEEITNYEVKNMDGDERGRIEQCFDKMSELIDKGLQIYSTIDSPKEAQALFAPLEMKYLDVSEKLKLLEKNDNE